MTPVVRLVCEDRGVSTPVVIGTGILQRELAAICATSPDAGLAVIVARRVAELWEARLDTAIPASALRIIIDDSEERKTLESAGRILDELFSHRLRRDWIVLCVGGGVTGDLGAFAASIALRGVSVIHVPTTLLAQVDSSIGGKTGVNHATGKNLIGTFHPALAVISDAEFLTTLDRDQIRAGMFEALKCGVIADRALFHLVTSIDEPPDLGRLQEVVAGAARIKCDVVSRDPRETGDRRLLNYGHTLGHALEKVLDYRGVTHGDAVGRGMIAANAIGVRVGVTPADVADAIGDAIARLAPASLPRKVSADELMEAAQLDKKFDTSKLRVVLPEAIGKACVTVITQEDLRAGAEALAAQL